MSRRKKRKTAISVLTKAGKCLLTGSSLFQPWKMFLPDFTSCSENLAETHKTVKHLAIKTNSKK